MKRLAMFDTKPYDKSAFERYGSINDISFTFFETKLTEATVGLASGYDGVVVFVNDSINKAVIDALYGFGIQIIALRSAGFNNVDVKAAYKKIHIVRVPEYSPYAVAEHAMAILLTLVRKTHKAYLRTRDFNFSLTGLTGFDLHGKTVGIIGTGKIGKVFAGICDGFGINVLAYDIYRDENAGLHYVPLDELFAKSDIISLHCPLTKETEHIIDLEAMKKMKDGVILINTSRGSLINAEDLLEEIKSKKVGGACLDVYEEESDIFFEDFSGRIVQDDVLARLISMPNVIVTSHQAFLTEDALEKIAETTVKNIRDFFDGKDLENELCYHCQRKEACKKERIGRCF